jgi:hypothetical protein
MAIPLRVNSIAAKFRRSEKHPKGESRYMNPKGLRKLHDSRGKGILGCVVFIFLFGVAIFLAISLGPLYYSNFNFESDVKTEASRAGAHSLNDSTIVRDILVMAKRNDIRLEKEDILIDRYAGQVHIEVNYSVPVSFVFFQRNINFKIDASSFVGAL